MCCYFNYLFIFGQFNVHMIHVCELSVYISYPILYFDLYIYFIKSHYLLALL
jgi:hypothetical protein